MSETEPKKKRLKGFTKIVANEVEVLNTIEKFKEDFKDKLIKIMLNPKDGKQAALLVIDNGRIYVEGVDNNPKENIKKKVAGWDGFFQTDTKTFADLLGGGDITTGQSISVVKQPVIVSNTEDNQVALSPEIEQILHDRLQLVETLAKKSQLVAALEESSVQNKELSLSEITQLDEQWKATEGVDDFIKPFLSNQTALLLIRFQCLCLPNW